jgi:hypothetical protein
VTSPDPLSSRVSDNDLSKVSTCPRILVLMATYVGLVRTQLLGRAREAFGAAGGEGDAEQERERHEKRAVLGPGSAAGGPPRASLPGSRWKSKV